MYIYIHVYIYIYIYCYINLNGNWKTVKWVSERKRHKGCYFSIENDYGKDNADEQRERVTGKKDNREIKIIYVLRGISESF